MSGTGNPVPEKAAGRAFPFGERRTFVDILQEANEKYVYGVTVWKNKLYASWTNSLQIYLKRQGRGTEHLVDPRFTRQLLQDFRRIKCIQMRHMKLYVIKKIGTKRNNYKLNKKLMEQVCERKRLVPTEQYNRNGVIKLLTGGL